MSRTHETSITIDAPIEEVWRAITEAREIERWFAPTMRVEPGVGGNMFASWGPGMEGTQTIEVWEPNRQLRLIDQRDRTFGSGGDAAGAATPVRLVVDYFLESQDGKTVLRLVHSGFGPGADWDGEYEGTRSGWPGFFRTLKHGLERHPGKSTHNVTLFHVAPPGDADALWNQFFAAVPWQGREIARGENPRTYLGTVAGLDDAMLSVAFSGQAAGQFIYVSLLLYGLPPERIAAVEQEWKAAVAQLPSAAPKE